MHFHFKSIRISSISSIGRVTLEELIDANGFPNDTSLCGAILVLFLEYRLGHRGTALCSWVRYFTLIVPLSTQVYTAISRNVVGKKAQNCTSQSRKIVWVDVKSYCTCRILMRYNNKISANFRFLSFQTCRNKVRLAPLNFRRIFLTQRHATVKVKLQI